MRQRSDESLLEQRADRCCHDHAEDKTPAELRESAYRRGYQQGFEMAVEAVLQDGMSGKELQRLRRLISDWRFRRGQYRQSRAGVRRPPEEDAGVIYP
jgi:hypothetical protein